jgi:hypothetical protein
MRSSALWRLVLDIPEFDTADWASTAIAEITQLMGDEPFRPAIGA